VTCSSKLDVAGRYLSASAPCQPSPDWDAFAFKGKVLGEPILVPSGRLGSIFYQHWRAWAE